MLAYHCRALNEHYDHIGITQSADQVMLRTAKIFVIKIVHMFACAGYTFLTAKLLNFRESDNYFFTPAHTIVLLSNPSGSSPDVFKRTVPVAANPVAAEYALHYEYGYAHENARSDAEARVETPVVIDSRADDALCHIVGHAHLAVRNQSAKPSADPASAVVSENHAACEQQHETEIGKRRQNYAQRSQYVRIGDVGADHIVKAIEREEADQRHRKNSLPHAQILAAKPALATY